MLCIGPCQLLWGASYLCLLLSLICRHGTGLWGFLCRWRVVHAALYSLWCSRPWVILCWLRSYQSTQRIATVLLLQIDSESQGASPLLSLHLKQWWEKMVGIVGLDFSNQCFFPSLSIANPHFCLFIGKTLLQVSIVWNYFWSSTKAFFFFMSNHQLLTIMRLASPNALLKWLYQPETLFLLYYHNLLTYQFFFYVCFYFITLHVKCFSRITSSFLSLYPYLFLLTADLVHASLSWPHPECDISHRIKMALIRSRDQIQQRN